MQVDIYIQTTYKGPSRTSGKYCYLLRYFTKNQLEAICWDDRCIVAVDNCTQNLAELLALKDALSRMTKPCKLTICSDTPYLKNGVENWSKAWIENGWVTAKGKPVANSDEWKEVLELLKQHEPSFFTNQQHEFRYVMNSKMKGE